VSASEGADAPGGLASAWRTITLVVMGLLGVAVAVALIVTLGQANGQRERAQRLQSHSYDVTVLARTLSATIARSEASLGRFVISGDKQLGQLYYDDWRRAGDQIDRLERLTADSPEQQRRIERLRRAYRVRGAELSLTALSTNYGKNQQALSRYYQARKAPALVEMDALLDRIIRGERTLLRRRTEAAMTTVAQAGRAARVLSVFGAGLVLGAIALGWLTVRALGERAVARADAEAERRRAEELAVAVAEATETLRAQEVQLRQVQKMEAVGQLTGGIAHDFNNMLAVVIGGIELARRGLLTGADVSRHLDSAGEGAQRAAALTRQLLAFARERSSDPEPVAAGALVAGMRDLLDRTLGDAIRVEVSDASDGTHVRADRVQFENTILNLAVNARDAMEGRGTLAIALGIATLTAPRGACAPGDYLRLAVADTGCGMSPEVVERAFEPFFTTKPVGKGTGLGLSQIFAFARQAGGDVEIASVPGSGTRVTLLLPRCQPADTASPAIEPQFVASPSGSLRILVVEDDPRVLRATVGALEELGHIPLPCADPLAAPAMLAGAAADLIISDVLMPGRTGPEMIAALAPEHAALPVLFVTGFAGDAAAGPDLGGRPVLRKPFTLAALERAIGEAAGERPTEQIAAE
jgi:signal transduction histidine kinase/ActR/RegA family two-component response regulator